MGIVSINFSISVIPPQRIVLPCLSVYTNALPLMELLCLKKLDNLGRDNLIFAGIIPYKSSDPGIATKKAAKARAKF